MSKKNTSADSPALDTPIVHLICQAHIDPVWMWTWQEGGREAISTFHTAANLLEEFPDFVFNHNESLLYEWIEDNDPALFERIRKLVKQGRWHIAGGWYVQPDCNMPGGETLVRQMLEGRRYFERAFGARPTVAYNFDSFGHPASLPQMLKQAGFDMYLHCRPPAHALELPAALYRWQGRDGASVLALRPDTGWYCTGPIGAGVRTARDQAVVGVEQARQTGRDSLVLWGLGDHGGGPTRADLLDLAALMAETQDVAVRHSTPEAYLERIRGQVSEADVPAHAGELQRTFAGCYTSVARIKRGMRRSEAALASAERWASIAWWRAGLRYPARRLRQAWKAVLLNSFHDTMAGSLAELADQGVMDLFGYANHIASDIVFKSQNALLPATPPEPGRVPLYVFNPHPYPLKAPVGLHVVMDYRPAAGLHPFELLDDGGQRVTSQTGGGQYEQSKGGFQPHVQFVADMPPLSVRRYELRPAQAEDAAGDTAGDAPLSVVENARAIVVENRWFSATFTRGKAALTSLVERASGRELLSGPVRVAAMRDTGDAWGGDTNADFSTPVGEFAALTPEQVGEQWAGEDGTTGKALRVLPAAEELLQGGGRKVACVVEGLTGWRRSLASIQVTLYADLPWVDVAVRLHWQERRKMAKLVIPFEYSDPRVTCEIPYGAAQRAADGSEHVQNRWLRLDANGAKRRGGKKSAKPPAGVSIGLANDGVYGFSAQADGAVALSLARGAVHTRWGDLPIEPDEHHTFTDQGQIDTKFRLVAGSPDHVTRGLLPAALELNQPLEAFAVFYPPMPQLDPAQAAQPFLRIEPDTVQLGTLKKAEEEDEEALIVRLIETAGQATQARLTVEGATEPYELELKPHEIATLKIARKRKGVTVKPCGLLED